MRGWTLAALLLAVACGMGTDGKPVAPPTIPSPAPPEPPGQVTGVRIAERGPDHLVWEWEPVEGVTGYEVDVFPVGTPPEERNPLVLTAEPTLRVDGLVPGMHMGINVRAVRETAGGRAEGPWADFVTAEVWPDPRDCTDERDMALAFGTEGGWAPPVLIEDWDGTPFHVYFDDAIPASERADLEHNLGVMERLAARIEEQIDYPLLELGGSKGSDERGFVIRNDWVQDCVGVRPGGIVVTVVGSDAGGARASPECGVVFWTRNDIGTDRDSVMPHELFHLFGFTHSPESGHPWQTPPGDGIPMSVRLTNRPLDARDLGVTFEDVDALRCIFPR